LFGYWNKAGSHKVPDNVFVLIKLRKRNKKELTKNLAKNKYRRIRHQDSEKKRIKHFFQVVQVRCYESLFQKKRILDVNHKKSGTIARNRNTIIDHQTILDFRENKKE
jgi:hypothetical protein